MLGHEHIKIIMKSLLNIQKTRIKDRLFAETPPLFRIIRNTGLALAAAGGALLASPVALPSALVTFAGYLTVAGTVMGAVSQAVVPGE